MTFLDKNGLSRLWAYVIEHLGKKVDKVDGKGLSTNDYTTDEKLKLDSIEVGANNTVVDSALNAESENPVQNKIIKSEFDAINALIGEASVEEQIEAAVAGIPQTDWNQSDSSAPDYIKNRTHSMRYVYDIGSSETLAEGEIVKISDLSTAAGGVYEAFKISQMQLENSSEAIVAEFKIILGGVVSNPAATVLRFEKAIDTNNYIMACGSRFRAYVIMNVNTLTEEYKDLFPTNGVYLEDQGVVTGKYFDIVLRLRVYNRLDDRYISSRIARTSEIPDIDTTLSIADAAADAKTVGDALALKADKTSIVQSDWNVNDPNDAAFVLNRPCYTYEGDNALYRYTVNGQDGSIAATEFLLPNEWYKVTIVYENGETEELPRYKCQSVSMGGGVYKCSLYNLPDNGLGIYQYNDGFMNDINVTVNTNKYPVGTTINIIKIMEIVVPLDEKFISDIALTFKNFPAKSGKGRASITMNLTSGNIASGDYSHAEGCGTTASAWSSHAEGNYTTASGDYSHAEGTRTTASARGSHAEGCGTTASGDYSHAEGNYTAAERLSQHVQGEYNVLDTVGNNVNVRGEYVHIVGNGSYNKRSNAHTLDWSGNAWYQGDVYVGSTSGTNRDDGSKKLATEEYVDNSFIKSDFISAPTVAAIGQTIVVKAVDESGKPTEWEAVDPMIIRSSTEGSTKQFKIMIDDTGTLTVSEVV